MLLELGDAQMQQGDAAGARKSLEEVREIDLQTPFARPEIEMALARLSLAAGQSEDAASRARGAMNTFTTAGREGDRVQAAALLARALIARGETGEASAVLAQVPSPEGHAFPIEAAVQFRIARYMVAAGSGRRAEADRGLDAIAAEVSRLGLAPLEKQARVAREAVMKPNLSQAAFSH
jgi:thioredoxin-like negative regulator of GroEL